MKTVLLIITLLAPLCCIRCSQSVSPGSSDHGNARISGKFNKSIGEAATEATVILLPDTANYYVDSADIVSFTASSDTDGQFQIDSIPEGIYCLFAMDAWSGRSFVMKKIIVRKDTVINFGVLDMSIPGTIYFNIDSLGVAPGAILYFPGLPLFHTVDTTSVQWINDVPATNAITLMGYDPSTRTPISLSMEFRELEVPSGTSIFIPYRIPPPWYVADNTKLTRQLEGTVGTNYLFSAVDPATVSVDTRTRYRFSWGDGEISAWSTNYYASHSWGNENYYHVQTQTQIGSTVLAWSEAITIHISEKK